MRIRTLLAVMFLLAFSTACLAQVDEFQNAARTGDIEKLRELFAADPGLVNARDADCLLYTSPSPRD